MRFEYFRGTQAEQYTFYRIPKLLFTSENFRPLSCEAKLLYGLMLDRMSLSMKSQWLDEEDRVYIIFPLNEIMDMMGCARQKAVKCLDELTDYGLIERKRLGFGRPNVIYVKNFVIPEDDEELACTNPGERKNQTKQVQNFDKEEDVFPQKYENQTSRSMKNEFQEVPKSNFKKYENQTLGSSKIKLQEVPKSNSNNTDKSNTDYNKIYHTQSYQSIQKGQDQMDVMDTYREILKANISYECFLNQEVDELLNLMVEVMMYPDDLSIRIGGIDKPAAMVKSQYLKLQKSHIAYVLDCMKKNTSKITNIRAYLLTALYNAPLTMSSYYQAAVNHDMYGET